MVYMSVIAGNILMSVDCELNIGNRVAKISFVCLFVCLSKRQRSIPNSVLYGRISRINFNFPAAI